MKPGCRAPIPAHIRGIRRRYDPTLLVRDRQPEVERVKPLGREENVRHGRAVTAPRHYGLRQRLDVAVPLRDQEIQLFRDTGRRQGEAFPGARDQSRLAGANVGCSGGESRERNDDENRPEPPVPSPVQRTGGHQHTPVAARVRSAPRPHRRQIGRGENGDSDCMGASRSHAEGASGKARTVHGAGLLTLAFGTLSG